VQARILPSFKHLAGALAENGGLLRSFFTNSASVIGANLDKFAAIAQTPLFKKEFGALIRESTGALDGFLSVGLKLGQAFGGIATAIEPAQHALGQLVEHLATMFAVWAQGAGQSQLQSFFGAMVRSLTVVGSLLAHVGQALGHVFIDAYPASVRLVQGVDRLFQSFDRFVTGHGAGISGVFNGIADSLGAIEHWVEANQTSIGTILSSAFTIARTAATGFEDALKLIAPALSSLLTILAPLASALASVSTALGGLGSLAALGTAVVAVTALRGALVGLRAAMVGIAGAGALAGAGEALAGLLSPTTAIIAALVGAGALWAAFSGGVRNAGAAAQDAANKLNDLRDAVRGLRDAQAGALGATQAHKDAVWAYNDSVRATREAVANLANVEKDEHATAQQLRDAHERVTAAYRARADAATQVKITSSELANADDRAADANHKVAAGARAAASAFAAADAEARHSAQAVETAANAARAGHQAWKIHADAAAQDAQAARVAKAALDAYVASNAAATGPMSAVNQALADLATKLGRIPPKKLTEVAVNIIQHGGTLGDVIAQINAIRSKTVDITANIHNHASTDAAHKARGGFIRGPANAGDTIPIYVTPGEVVLNRSQQAVVGHGRIAAALGGAASHFTAGMGYAKGKKPPPTPKTHHAASISPSRLKSPRYPASVDPDSKLGKALSGVKDALMDVETASQTGSDDDKRYSNLARQYDIEAPNLTQTIPDPGNPGGTIDVRDEQGISARTRQLSDLIGLKNTIISDMDAQRDLMNRAIARLKAALEQLAEAIVTAHENLKEERKKAAELDRNAKTNRSDATSNEDKGRAISDQIATEKQKKKPDQKRIDTLEDQRRGFYNTAHAQRERAQQDEAASQQHSQNAGRLEGRLRELQDTQSDYTQKVGDLSATITHQMPFDRQGLVLDVEELQKQQRDVAATQSQAPSTPGGTGGPSGGPDTVPTPSGGDTSGGVVTGADNSPGLLAQISALKLALAVQGAQLPILGSFRSGALHVPQDGVAMLHAGEKIIRPGVRDSAGSGGDSKLAVELHLKDQLGDFVDARVLKVAGPLIVQMGNQADQRRREGRFSAR
jgi:hypothetical protein